MKTVKINTRNVGYNYQNITLVTFSYHTVTRPNDFATEILGDTWDDIEFDSFKVEGLEALAFDFVSEGETKQDAAHLVVNHLKTLVRRYIRGYDSFDIKHVEEMAVRNETK